MSQPSGKTSPIVSGRVGAARWWVPVLLAVCGLLAAVVVLPASATMDIPSHGTVGSKKTSCSDADKPGATPHFNLESTASSASISVVVAVENTWFNPENTDDVCNQPQSLEIWFVITADSTTANRDAAKATLAVYRKGATPDTNVNAQNPISDHAVTASDVNKRVRRWQYNYPTGAGYSTSSKIFSGAPLGADTWICAMPRVNTAHFGSGAVGVQTSPSNGPSNEHERGDFGIIGCAKPGSPYEWDHHCDNNGNEISGEVEDADVRSRITVTENGEDVEKIVNVADGKLTKDDLDAYKCTPHPCDIVNPTPSSSYGFNIDDLNTDGSTDNHGFATLDGDDASVNFCRTLCDRRDADSTGRYTTPPSTPGADGNVNYADGDANGDGNITSSDLNARPAYQWTRCGMNKREAQLGRALEWWEERMWG